MFAADLSDWITNPSNGNLYKLIQCGAWSACEVEALSQGSHLVTVNNASEQSWLVTTFGGGELFWIGFTDQAVNGTWQWISGQPVTYTNWASGEPNDFWGPASENWAAMNWSSPGRWVDFGPVSPEWSSITKAIIEQLAPTPTPTPIPGVSSIGLAIMAGVMLGTFLWFSRSKKRSVCD
ncbi:MAG: lectin [Chloroflexi bacterium]|nr:lectin [Chloroflexota bacterium]